MTDDVETPTTSNPHPPDSYYTEKKKRVKDFWLGFLGSFLGNALLVLLYFFLLGVRTRTPQGDNLKITLVIIATMIDILLPWVLSLSAIIYFLVKRRRWVAFGILASFTAAFALIFLYLIGASIWCFIASPY